MKERGKTGSFGYDKRPPFPRCLSIDIFIFLCIVIIGPLRVRQNLNQTVQGSSFLLPRPYRIG